MRAMKRTVSIVLALMMVLGMATMGISVASATETNTVTFTSNIGANGTVEYVPGTTEQVTVCYDLTTTYGIVNIQGKVFYDPTVLQIANQDVLPNLTSLQTSINTGLSDHVTFNASGYTPVDFSTKKTLVKVVFNVIGSGNTTVNLSVDYLTGNTAASSTTAATDVDLVADGTADSTKMTTAADAVVYPEIEEELVDFNTFLYGYSSYLAGEVSLLYRFWKAPTGYDPATLQVRFSGPERLTDENVTIDYTALESANARVSQHYYHLYSPMFTEPITCEILQNGQVIARDTYSIEQYVVDKLPTTTNTKLANLYKTLLNFGAKAQTQFSYNTENPADARIDYTAPTVSASDIVLPAEISTAHPDVSALGLTYYRGTGEYLAATSLKVQYRKTNNTKFASASVTVDGEEAAFTNANTSGSVQQVVIEGIPSPYLDKVYTLKYSNNAEYKTSIIAQVKQKLTDEPSNQFYMAIYLYNQAANEYFGV